MKRYIARRLLQAIPTVFLASIVIFLMIYLIPGDPASVILGQNATPAQIEATKEEMGLDKSLPEQYVIWLGRVLRGNLGESFINGFPVADLLERRLAATLQLTIAALTIATVMALVLVMVVYRQWRIEHQWRIFRETVRESSMILMIIGAAAVFSYMMSLLYITQSAAQWLVDLNLNRWVLMITINIFLLIAGCFLPPVAIILMVMPILTPVLEAANFDLIWFAVILTINMEVGLITPPVGLNLYVLKGVAPDVPLVTVLKGSMPFVLLMFLAMLLISVFPQIALWLPSRMMGS